MRPPCRPPWLLLLFLFAMLAVCELACGLTPTSPAGSGPSPPGDDADSVGAWSTDDEAGGTDVGVPIPGPAADAMSLPPGEDASNDGPVLETGVPDVQAPDDACAAPLAAGDLVIDELMIESVAGAGDYGEWLEVTSTLPCAINLRGLHGECPSGAKLRTFDVTGDQWLAAGSTFVVADSDDPAIDHDLPGTVIAWSGVPGDVLRNKGGTVSLFVDGFLVDSVTYPALKLVVGAATSFPSDCPFSRRSDWTAWQTSNASWFPGFSGTPNAPNDDVHCP